MAFDVISSTNLLIFFIIGFVLISLSYIAYILIYVITQTRKLKKNVEISTCSCGGTNQLYLKDILVQFWFITVFIYIIIHIIFQFAFTLYDSYVSSTRLPNPAYEISTILIILFILIIAGAIFAVVRRKKRFTWEHHKSPKAFIQTLQVFYIAISVILIANVFITTLPFSYNHLLLYEIFNKLSLIFPAFFLNAIFYMLLKKYLEAHTVSMINQVLIGFVFMILPFFIWMILLLLIQNIWPFVNYGILSGLTLGFLFVVGIDNMMTLINKGVKVEYRYRISILLIIAILINFRIIITVPLINLILSIIFIIISYLGLNVEFFIKGNETQYFQKLSKKDYPYYIIIGIMFLLFLFSLETLFNSTFLINNVLFVQHDVLYFLFDYSLRIGAMSPILFIIYKKESK